MSQALAFLKQTVDAVKGAADAVYREIHEAEKQVSDAMAAIAGGGQAAEIVYRPSWRYWRAGYTNGAVAQTRFALGSLATAV